MIFVLALSSCAPKASYDVAAGLEGLHLQAIVWRRLPATLSDTPGDNEPTQDKTLQALGFDSVTNYQWCHLVSTDRDYMEWAEGSYLEPDAEFGYGYLEAVRNVFK